MHWTRIWTLIGVVLGVAALFTKGATSDGEELLPALSQGGEFPDGISTIWGGLDTWVQVVVVIAIIVVVAFALIPPLNLVETVPYALTTTLIGVALLITRSSSSWRRTTTRRRSKMPSLRRRPQERFPLPSPFRSDGVSTSS